LTLAFPKPQKPERGTAEARRYMDLVAQLPCVSCNRYGVECHHPIMGRFAQRKSSDLDVIPVCPPCHRNLHASPASWRLHFGADYDHVEPTRKAVEQIRRRMIGGRT
jgi:hypothetical protein